MPELLITFLGDWRIGTGTGSSGALDDTVRRENGLPVLPAGSLTGIWRDGCERVATALDGADPAALWAGWVRTLFGSQPAIDGRHQHVPVPAALAVRTATLPAPVAAALRADPRLAHCLHSVRPGVAINPKTGQATTDFLRALEVTRSGLSLHAPLELDDAGWTEDQRVTAWTLLHLGAREVRALGGDRRRGLGRCELTVPDPTGAVAGALACAEPPVPALLPGRAPTGHVSAAARNGGWVVLDLRVSCVDPVLSASVATDNTVRGQASVPGSRVLPVVVARARAAGLDVEHLVRAGDLRCEPLVPEVDGAPGRPLPRTFVAQKGAPVRRLWNRLHTTSPSGVTSKPPRDRWVGNPRDSALPLRSADLQVRMHNTVEDKVQRPTEAVGGLFGYESIPAGQVLRGRIRLRVSAGDGKTLAAALTGRWRLGRSKKDDYGRVDVTASVAPASTAGAGRGVPQVSIWFVTDAVILDTRLAPVTTVDGVVAALGAALDTPVELAPAAEGMVSAAVVFGRAEGWQGRWVRPRPSLLTVAAGSVLVVRRSDGQQFESTALQALADDGIGQRRAEGFGVTAIGDPVLDLPEITVSDVADRPSAGTDPGPPDEAGRELLAELRREALRRDVEQRAATLPRDTLRGLASVPPSQLGALRVTLHAAARAENPAVVTTRLLASLRAAKARSDRWSDQAERVLRDLLDDGAVWELLKIPAEHRTAEAEPWARTRVLAHLLAAGTSAAEGGTDHGA